MINQKRDCVHYKAKMDRCEITRHIDCNKCSFYKNRKQWDEMKKKYPMQ